MKRKPIFAETDTQIEDLKNALRGGAPLVLALQYAQIQVSTYYYWVAMASIVKQAKSQEELESLEEIMQSGVSLQDIRDMSEQTMNMKRTGIGTFITPSQESILQYKNNRKFHKFADKCYEIISECDKIRSQLALAHLSNIRKSTDKGSRINASGSMWFLERTLSDFFGKASDKAIEKENQENIVEPIRVEYVDANDKNTKDRVKEMEEELERKLNGEGRA